MFRMVPFGFSVEKVRRLEKSTPAVLVALVTNYSYADSTTPAHTSFFFPSIFTSTSLTIIFIDVSLPNTICSSLLSKYVYERCLHICQTGRCAVAHKHICQQDGRGVHLHLQLYLCICICIYHNSTPVKQCLFAPIYSTDYTTG